MLVPGSYSRSPCTSTVMLVKCCSASLPASASVVVVVLVVGVALPYVFTLRMYKRLVMAGLCSAREMFFVHNHFLLSTLEVWNRKTVCKAMISQTLVRDDGLNQVVMCVCLCV